MQIETNRVDSDESSAASSRREPFLGVLVVVWLLLVVVGLGMLMNYSNRPGQIGDIPTRWPDDSAYQRSVSRPTMVLFAHPKCPCTAATLDELAWIMTRCGDGLDCQVLFVRPQEEEEAWVRTSNWSKASRIPNVNVLIDHEGRDASLFGAKTSGHAMLFDADGKLQFEGGITPSRGHRGDNWGRERVVSLVLDDGPASDPGDLLHEESTLKAGSARVFGCPLFVSPGSAESDDRFPPDDVNPVEQEES